MNWIDDARARSDGKLEWYVRDYFAATASDDVRAAADLAEWDRIRFRPRALQGEKSLSTSTTALGTNISTPVLVAPMAQQVAADPRGESATAAAVRRSGSILGVSSNTAVEFAEIQNSGAPWWFQVYLYTEPATTRRIVTEAARRGASAIILTIDTTSLVASRPGMEPTEWPDVPGRARLVNLTPAERAAEAGGIPPNPGLDDIGALREISGLPVVVKGILRADDARAAIAAGASGIIVSTHGGRRMSGSTTSLRALPEVVAAAQGTGVEVYVDSGIRSGSHVLTALALGARAVFVGRPIMWSLADAGEEGVASAIARLTREFRVALDQSGVSTVEDLRPDLLC